MGSKYFRIHVADPDKIIPMIHGKEPGLVERVYSSPKPPEEALRGVFEVMAQSMLVFMCGQPSHPEGINYTKAMLYLLDECAEERTDIEFYPEEGSAFWGVVWDRCEADWLNLPVPEYEIGRMSWRSPMSCSQYARNYSWKLSSGSYEPRYSPQASLEEAEQVLQRASSSRMGAFITYIG